MRPSRRMLQRVGACLSYTVFSKNFQTHKTYYTLAAIPDVKDRVWFQREIKKAGWVVVPKDIYEGIGKSKPMDHVLTEEQQVGRELLSALVEVVESLEYQTITPELGQRIKKAVKAGRNQFM